MAARPSESAFASMEENFRKRYGADSLTIGRKIRPYDVISTGSIWLDAATIVGGYVEGKLSQIWGSPDSGKSSLALQGMAQAQRKYPKKRTAFIDVEHKWDDAWAEAQGVDRSRCYLIQPKTAEEVSDELRDLVGSGLISMAVVDSVGAMIGKVEMEKEADEATYAGASKIVTRMVKQATSMAARTETVVLILNQVRDRIGGSYQSQVLPGGWCLRHATTVQIFLRVGGSRDDTLYVKVEGEKDPIPVGHKIVAKVERNKVGPEGYRAEFMFLNQESVYGPIGIDVADEAAVLGVRYGLIHRAGAWYTLPSTGERFNGEKRLKEHLRANPDEMTAIRTGILSVTADLVKGVEAEAEESTDAEMAPEEDVLVITPEFDSEQTGDPVLPGVSKPEALETRTTGAALTQNPFMAQIPPEAPVSLQEDSDDDNWGDDIYGS